MSYFEAPPPMSKGALAFATTATLGWAALASKAPAWACLLALGFLFCMMILLRHFKGE